MISWHRGKWKETAQLLPRWRWLLFFNHNCLETIFTSSHFFIPLQIFFNMNNVWPKRMRGEKLTERSCSCNRSSSLLLAFPPGPGFYFPIFIHSITIKMHKDWSMSLNIGWCFLILDFTQIRYLHCCFQKRKWIGYTDKPQRPEYHYIFCPCLQMYV